VKKYLASLLVLIMVIVNTSSICFSSSYSPATKIIGNYENKDRILELFNYTGITNGQLTNPISAKESFVIHHYNDSNLAQFDNVGRKNNILVLKNARNYSVSKHNETGSGTFIQFMRDFNGELPKVTYTTDDGIKDIYIGNTVYDKFNGNVYRAKKQMLGLQLNIGDYTNEIKWSFVGGYGNETLGMIDCVDWNSLDVSKTKNDYGIAITGRMGDKSSDTDLGRTLKPILMYTKGVSTTKKGSTALNVYSLPNGGGCVELSNTNNSQGNVLTINNSSENSSIKILNKSKSGTNIEVQRTSKNNKGDVIHYKDENGKTLFQITGDGEQIKMTDSATGQLRSLTISNGKLVIK
jgi:hypothetical protein